MDLFSGWRGLWKKPISCQDKRKLFSEARAVRCGIEIQRWFVRNRRGN